MKFFNFLLFLLNFLRSFEFFLIIIKSIYYSESSLLFSDLFYNIINILF